MLVPSDPSNISDPAIRALAREVASLTREVESLKRGQRTSQLGSSSIDDGTLWVRDGQGVNRVAIGRQVDGKFGWGAINGDAPPRPTPPNLSAGPNGITVGWDGQFVGPVPSDFVHVKAFLSPVGPDFIPSDGNCVGHLLGNSRFPVTPLPQTGHWAVLIAYNTSGVASQASIVAGPIVPGEVVATDILDGIVTELKLADDAVTAAKLAAGAVGTAQLGDQVVDLSKLADNSVDATKLVDGSVTPAKVSFTAADIGSIATYYQAAAPTAPIPIGSLWADSDDQNKLYRWSGAGWVAVNDQGVAAALAAAQQAQTDAASALDAASGAEAALDGKVTVFYQPASPSGAGTGDLWLDTDDGNRLYRWSGSMWEEVTDSRIQQALVNAQTAQSTADGKITAFYQGTAPTTGMGVGDLWYNTASGNAVSRWNGSSWVPLPAGAGALADSAVTSPKLADNAVVAGKIAADAVGTNQLIANSVVAGKLSADSVTSTNIVAGGVQTANLAADAVAAGKIAADAVTSRELQALSVIADKIAANQINSGHIQAGSVTADKLEAILVLASQIIAGDPADWHLELGDSNTPILFWNGAETGFAVSRDAATGQSNVYLSGRVEFGNGSQIESDYLDLAEQPASGFQEPRMRQGVNHSPNAYISSTVARWGSATQKGSTLLLGVFAEHIGAGTPAILTPAGWTLVRTVAQGNSRLSLFMVANASTSRSTETVAADQNVYFSMALFEWQGLSSAPLDVSASASGTGTTASTGTTATTVQADELQFALWGSNDVNSYSAGSVTGGFTYQNQSTAYGQGYATAFRVATGTGAATSSITLNKSSQWLGMVATFRAAPAAGTPPTPRDGTLRLFSRSAAGVSTPHVIDDTGRVYPTGRVPFARVRLTTQAVAVAGVDLWAQGDWATSTNDDPWSMVAISTTGGTYSSVTVPVDGNYWVTYRTNFGLSSTASEFYVLACFVAKNNRTAASSVARWAHSGYNITGSDGTPVQTTRLVPLVAGDVLYWGNWANQNARFFPYQSSGGTTDVNYGVPTEITVAYHCPLT